jgi:TetR/AcrR family transcriptional repressor of mexJK operon
MDDLTREDCVGLEGGSGAVGRPPERRGSGGRPSQAEAVRRDARLVEIAKQMFMERGFDGTTIDAVAEAASVGKATLYARYKDKRALFAAVFTREVDRFLAPIDDLTVPGQTGGVRDALLALARSIMAHALRPEAVTFNRIIIAQAQLFPDLARLVYKEGWLRSTAAVADVLRHFAREGQIDVADPDLAGDFFLNLIVGKQTRLAMFGIETDPRQLDERLEAAVDFFLRGISGDAGVQSEA